MRLAWALLFACASCDGPRGDHALALGVVARGHTSGSSQRDEPPCAGDHAAPDASWTYAATRDGRYAVRAEGWIPLALTVWRADGAKLGCATTQQGAAAEVAVDLRAGDVIDAQVEVIDGDRGTHRISVREIVPLAAPITPPAQPERARVATMLAHAEDLELGGPMPCATARWWHHDCVERVVAITPDVAFESACGGMVATGGRALRIVLDVVSALEVHARSSAPLFLELHREGDHAGIVACGQGEERGRVMRRLPPGTYVLVIGADVSVEGADVTLETNVTPLDERFW